MNYSIAALGAGTALLFLLVAAAVSLVYSDGEKSSIVLPILLGMIGPTFAAVLAIIKSADNTDKISSVQTTMKDIQASTDPLLLHSAVRSAIAEVNKSGTSEPISGDRGSVPG